MSIFRPDEYKHQNPTRAIADSDGVRGGRRVVANRPALYALEANADQLKQDVTEVRVKVDALNSNAATTLLLVDIAQVGNAAGWQLVTVPVAPGGGDVTKAYVEQQDNLLRADIAELQADLTQAENDLNLLENTVDNHEARLDALEAGGGGGTGGTYPAGSFVWHAADAATQLVAGRARLVAVYGPDGRNIIPPNRQLATSDSATTLKVLGGVLENDVVYWEIELISPAPDPDGTSYEMSVAYPFEQPYTL